MDCTTFLRHIRSHDRSLILSFEQGRVVERARDVVCRDIEAAMARLQRWGVGAGARVGIRAPNSYRWLVYDVALMELRAVSVAFTDDFAGRAAGELIDRYSLSLLLLASRDATDDDRACPAVAFLDDDVRSACALPENGGNPDPEWEHPWLIFSSGSAGGLKGLRLSRHGVEESIDALVDRVGVVPGDRLLLFLPMSNFQQRMMYYAALWYGIDLIVADVPRLFQALKTLAATLLIAPPALYETVEARIMNAPVWKRAALRGAIALVGVLPTALRARAARTLFAEVHESFGGRMRFMITGMAPIKRSTLQLFADLQLPLYETYGLIEAGPLTLNVPGAAKVGSVGQPLRGVHIATAEDGEIIVTRARRAAAGYFEAADGEAERTFLDSVRVATGDVGFVDADGYLHLTGRKKDVIVSRGGEKIHPEAVEAEINGCPDVERAVVLDDDGSGLIAIVRPRDPADATAKERIRRFTDRLARRRPSFSFTDVVFTDMTFSRENGCLRPNLKLDRGRIAAQFRLSRPSPGHAPN